MEQMTILNARVSKAFKRRVLVVAAHEGLSISEWLRRVTEEKVREAEAGGLFFGDGARRIAQDANHSAPEPQPAA